ncbi:MAG TPA: M28 family peptidase [Vicinamibacteria bacterium]|nr:M28 family peptidase [Vicinamibacteria bacterium]
MRAWVGVVLTVLVSVLVPRFGRSAEERVVLSEVDKNAIEQHAREIVQHRRDGGSPGELAAVDYVVRTLRSEGIAVEVHEFPAYVSDPGECRLRVEGAEPREPTCRTQALAAPTPPGGVRGELVFVGEGAEEDYASVDVEGKVVLVNDLPLPWGVKHAQDAGAVGAIFMSYSELIQELTVSPIWGTPTHRNYQELPKIPSVNVNQSDGEALREASASGTVTVTLDTEVGTGFKTLRLPVATVASEKDPDGFVLVGGHIDGWHYAAVDEGASNAAMVEMARIFHRHRSELERGLKIAWWPAHSNGRYAGSAWYVDHAWMDLRENALAYMNIDGVGQIGATVYRSSNTASMDELARAVFKDVAGIEADSRRPGRDSDEGFYGIGLPLLQFNHSRVDPGGRYWFWHTTEDTFDKIDFDILAGDTKLYIAALHRLLTQPIPPIRLAAATSELKRRLEEQQEETGSHLDLSRAIERATTLDATARSLDERLSGLSTTESADDIARGMVRILRPVLRLTYEESGPYHQDPALEIPTLPGLHDLETIDRLARDSDLYRFTLVHLIRERNRLEDHIEQALAEAKALEKSLGT